MAEDIFIMNSKKEIRYSVIIPHFNSFEKLSRLISSIPIRKDVEIIVVDDYSNQTDFESFVSENSGTAMFVSNDGIKSAGTCRNIGVQKSTGEYLIFADADDYFCPDAFKIIDEITDVNFDSDIIFFTPTSHVEGNESLTSTRHVKYRDMINSYLNDDCYENDKRLRVTHNVPWSKIIKRELVINNKIKFDNTIVANDGIFSLKVGLCAGKISASNDTIYVVTASNNSLTSKPDVKRYRIRLQVYCRYYHLIDESDRCKLGVNPLSLLFGSLKYGVTNFIGSALFLKKNNIPLLKNFQLTRRKIIVLLNKGIN